VEKDGSRTCRQVSLEARPGSLRAVRHFVDEVAEAAGLGEEGAFDLKVAVSEACANAVEHASAPGGALEICAQLFADRLTVHITDPGGFQLSTRNPHRQDERGLGIPLMVALMDEVRFARTKGSGTTVSLSMNLSGAPAREQSG